MPVRSWAICMLPSCHLPPTLSSFPFLLLFCTPIPTFTFPVLSLPHLLAAVSLPHIFSPRMPSLLLSSLAFGSHRKPAAWSGVCSELSTVCVVTPSGHVGTLADSLIWTQCSTELKASIEHLKFTYQGNIKRIWYVYFDELSSNWRRLC